MKKILITAVGTLALLWFALFLVYIPSQLSKAQPMPFTGGPADVDLAFETVSIRPANEDLNLRAWWMPARDPAATILFVHGANSNKEDAYFGGLAYYAALVERDYNVLAIDQRNHGDSDSSPSGRLAFGREEYRDVIGALDWLDGHAPGLAVIGSGVSMGGATLIEAASRDSRMAGLVLFDPLLDSSSASLSGVVAMTGIPQAILAPTIWSASTFFAESEGARPLEVAATLTLPILLIQDIDDPVTHAEYARELATRNSQVSLYVMPAAPANHPVIEESGPWGSHASAFRIRPDEVMRRFDAFVAKL
jgi:alpha-beta hydrolase superfamily lysophospholipase